MHKNITLAIIARGISQYNHLSRRSIASPAKASGNSHKQGGRLYQRSRKIYWIYRDESRYYADERI